MRLTDNKGTRERAYLCYHIRTIRFAALTVGRMQRDTIAGSPMIFVLGSNVAKSEHSPFVRCVLEALETYVIDQND